MLKFISSVLLITFCTNIAYAQASQLKTEDKAVITPLDEGQRTPYTGLLLSPLAAAMILAEKESYEPRCKLKVETAVAENQARCDFALAELKTKTDAELRVLQIKLEAKSEELNVLDKKLKDEMANRPSESFWAAVGFGGGVLVTVLSAFLVSKASN